MPKYVVCNLMNVDEDYAEFARSELQKNFPHVIFSIGYPDPKEYPGELPNFLCILAEGIAKHRVRFYSGYVTRIFFEKR